MLKKYFCFAVYLEGKGFLKGNGSALTLRWHREPHKASLYKTRTAAINAIARRKIKSLANAKVYEIEMTLYGTEDDILEREILA